MPNRPDEDDYPFRGEGFDHARAQAAVRELLSAIGEDPTREGLLDTPRRVADFYRALMTYDPGKTETLFDSPGTDQMVVVSGMRVWSLCEHHLLPFWCDVSVGYIAAGKVLGLSKFARIAHKHAHRLQLQERLVTDIARELVEVLGTQDVGVLARGEHLCMTARGVRTPHEMVSSSVHGAFRDQPAVRAEFLSLIRQS